MSGGNALPLKRLEGLHNLQEGKVVIQQAAVRLRYHLGATPHTAFSRALGNNGPS